MLYKIIEVFIQMKINFLSNDNKKLVRIFLEKKKKLKLIEYRNKTNKNNFVNSIYFVIKKINLIKFIHLLNIYSFIKPNRNQIDSKHFSNINYIFLENYLFKFYLVLMQLRKFTFFKKKFKKKIKKRYKYFYKKMIKVLFLNKKPENNLNYYEKKHNFSNKIYLFESNSFYIKNKDTIKYHIIKKTIIKNIKLKLNLKLNIEFINFDFLNFFFTANILVIDNLYYKDISLYNVNTFFKSIKKLRWKRHWFKKKLLKYKYRYKSRIKIKKKKYSILRKKFFKRLFFFNYIKLTRITKKINRTFGLTKFNEFNRFVNIENKSSVRPYRLYPFLDNNYNNFFPIYKISVNKRKILNIFYRNKLQPLYNEYYNFYLLNFLEIFLNKKVWLKIINKPLVPKKVVRYFKKLFKKNKYYQNKIGKYFYLLEFYEILYMSIFYRDLQFFINWLKKIMEKLHIKKHKKLLKIIKYTLRDCKFLTLLKAIGFMMDVRGKLGVAGNAKKRHYSFTIGHVSFTTKNHDLSLVQTTVRTSTGVLGVSIFLAF